MFCTAGARMLCSWLNRPGRAEVLEFPRRIDVVAGSSGEAHAQSTPPEVPSTTLPTGTVTFLLTDIEGSTRGWEAQGELMGEAVARHYRILDSAITRHGGVRPVEQGEGDSLVAVFSRASDAIGAALDGQRALTDESWREGAEISVRMALHTAEAQLRDERFYVGPSLARCARLRALAHGGQVLVSNTTAELLADGLPEQVDLLPLGVHRLRGVGRAERVFQLSHPALPSRFPPLRSLEMLPNTLPTQLTSFIGREPELAELGNVVGRIRLVTLVGSGGCGKTRLAVQVAAEVGEAHPDGVWWVDLAQLSDPSGVPRAVLAALQIGDSRGRGPVDRLIAFLADQRVLLVLDNCEHVSASAAELLGTVLRTCPNVVAMATSREPLGVPGELAWRVPSLSLPPAGGEVGTALLGAYDAVRLFIERAVAVVPSFRVDNDTAPTVAEICSRLDGIPLAIELAAARVRTLSLQRILEALGDRFRLLTGGARTTMPRQQTLQASVEWSHDLLDAAERVLLRRLGTLSGDFSLEAAEAICAGEPIESSRIMQLLCQLVDRSLVVFDHGRDRYRLLQTIQHFAVQQLLAAGELEALRDRHATHFLAMAEAAAARLEAAPQVETLTALEADHDNLRAAQQWLLATGDSDGALRLVVAMTPFWTLHGHYAEAQAWFRRVLAQVPPAPSPRRARAVWGLGHLTLFEMALGSDFGVPETAQAAALAAELDDTALLARALADQGFLGLFVAPDTARAALETAIVAARTAGDQWALASALWALAFVWILDRDRADMAQPLLDELAGIADSVHSPYWRCWRDLCAGIAAWRQGRLAEARTALEAALTTAERFADPILEAYVIFFGLADVHIAQGDYAGAGSLVSRSVLRQRRSAQARQEGIEFRLAVLALALGDLPAARRRYQAIAGVRAFGIPLLNAELDAVLGRIALEEGDLAAARSAFEQVSAVGAQLDCPWILAGAHTLRGRLARASGDPAGAEDLHHRALAIALQHGFRGVVAETLEVLASLAVVGESHAEATRLLGAAQALRETTGQQRWPLNQSRYDADVAELKALLGDEAFERAWSAGRALSLEEAVAYASRARGERKRPSTGWAALTPTELRVVALAAEGLSNAEIGRRLFISAGTAKIHLSHIFTKLGVANRAALAAQATARGIDRG
jgi:predicted ATPase/class 3 adenylate cyclase/DNA-binding CsgD family transcriptional regulator